MPKEFIPVDPEEFGKRLCSLLESRGIERHGAGAYLSKRYKVRNVTANAWLNGEHRAALPTAQKIANDHGVGVEELYFRSGLPTLVGNYPVRDGAVIPYHKEQPADLVMEWPFDPQLFRRVMALSDVKKIKMEGAMEAILLQLESAGRGDLDDDGGRRILQRR